MKKQIDLDKVKALGGQNLVPTRVVTPASAPEAPKMGRPVSNRTCSRINGKPQTVFLTPEDKKRINDAAYFSGVDQSDIIRVAIQQYLVRNTTNGKLTPEAVADIEQYIKDTTL